MRSVDGTGSPASFYIVTISIVHVTIGDELTGALSISIEFRELSERSRRWAFSIALSARSLLLMSLFIRLTDLAPRSGFPFAARCRRMNVANSASVGAPISSHLFIPRRSASDAQTIEARD